ATCHVILRRIADRAGDPRLLAAVACAAVIVAWPSSSFAQPCCAGASVLTPARLTPLDDALLGLQLRGARIVGSFDSSGGYVSAPDGSTELDLEQDLIGTVRVLGRGQLSLMVPFVQTLRSA